MNRRPERLGELLPDLVADLARRHGIQPPTTLTDRTPMTAGHMDDLLDHLQQCVNEYLFRVNGPTEWRVGGETYEVDQDSYPEGGAAFLVRASDGVRFEVSADVIVCRVVAGEVA